MDLTHTDLIAGADGADAASLYRSIFERSTDAIAIIARDGRYVEQNEAHARLTGWSMDELRGLTPAVHLGDGTFTRIMRRLEADGYYAGEVESRHRSGRTRTVELSVFPVHDASGRVVAYVGATRDISARRTAELETMRRFERLQAMYRMTAALSSVPELPVIFREALDCLCTALRTDRASVLLIDPDGVMRFKAWRNLSDAYRRAVEGHSPWRPDGPAPATVMVRDIAADASIGELRRPILDEGIAAAAFVPLLHHGTLLGKFMLYFGEPHVLDADDVRLVEAVASHVAVAIARRRGEAELSRREREFETLAENSPDIIARFDRELRHVYVNPAIEPVMGRSRDDVMGRTHRELEVPDALAAQLEALIGSVFETGDSAEGEFCYTTPDGPRWFYSRVAPEFVADGVVQTVLGTTRDVTALKRAGSLQRLLADVGAAVASRLDYRDALDDVARLVTADFAEGCAIDLAREDGALDRIVVTDRTPRYAAIVRDLDARFPSPPDSPTGPATAFRTGATQSYGVPSDELLRAASVSDEQYRLWQALQLSGVISVPLLARGRSIGVITLVRHAPEPAFDATDVAFAEDLADRVAIAVDNLQLFEASLAANRTKSDFMATMSHELRTPLNAIMGYTDLLHMQVTGPLNEQQDRQLERIRGSTRHLLTVIEEILTFSRTEAGREDIQPEQVDAAELAREAAAMVEPAAQQKGLDFILELPDTAVTVETDAVKLRQVLLNLLSNACKFTDDGAVTFSVSHAGDRVVFTVADTGVGIEADQLDRIFEPFWQVRGGNTRRIGGTGLGLTVSRQLVTLLGGELTVTSEPGAGSRFVVTLPLTLPPAQ